MGFIWIIVIGGFFNEKNKRMLLCLHAQSLSCVRLFVTPWTTACQAPLCMGFSRQEYWSGLLYPSWGDLPDPGSNPRLLLGRRFSTAVPPGKPVCYFRAKQKFEHKIFAIMRLLIFLRWNNGTEVKKNSYLLRQIFMGIILPIKV